VKDILLPNGEIAFEFEDLSFINTSLLTETARDFKKYGVYCKAHPKSLEYKEFWDREEDRRKNGIVVPGRLVNGVIQEIRITGRHYSYLNYGRIKKTDSDALYNGNQTGELILKNKTFTALKDVDFPDFWDGDYHYFHAVDVARKLGYNLEVFKARRKGYSYKGGFVAADEANIVPYSTSIIGAFDKKYLTKGDGTMRMAVNYLQWFEEYTDFNRGFLSTASDEYELGYVPKGTKYKKGYRSKILALSFKDNPEAAIGKDANLIIIDESGKFPNLKEMLDVTIPTMEDGDIITGMIIIYGTGGTKDADWVAFESEFYRPHVHRFMPFHNVWDDDARGTVCGFFHSHILNLKPYIDVHGNSLKEEALNATLVKREDMKHKSDKVTDFSTYISLRCTKPSEGFSNSAVNFFASDNLRDHFDKVKHDPDIKYLSRTGVLEEDNKTKLIKFKTHAEMEVFDIHPPLDRYHFAAKDDLYGCYVEWYPPHTVNGMVPENLYRVWHDPYALPKDKDSLSFGDSLGATYVFERENTITSTGGGMIVACYVGRPPHPDDYNEQLLYITRRYNAICQFENDRGDVLGYFKRAGYYHCLGDQPDFEWKRELAGRITRDKGISMNNFERKATAAMLLKQWLYTKRTTDQEGNQKYNFHYIYDTGLLDELLKWNLKGNFDRVSALLVGILDKNEIFNTQIREVAKADYTNGDAFFFRDWF